MKKFLFHVDFFFDHQPSAKSDTLQFSVEEKKIKTRFVLKCLHDNMSL